MGEPTAYSGDRERLRLIAQKMLENGASEDDVRNYVRGEAARVKASQPAGAQDDQPGFLGSLAKNVAGHYKDVFDQVNTPGPDHPLANAIGAAGSSFTDNFAMGLPGKVLDLLPDSVTGKLGLRKDQRKAARDASPVGQFTGNTLAAGGDMVAGPVKMAAKGSQMLMEQLEAKVPAVAGLFSKPLVGPAAKMAGQGGLTNAFTRGTRAVGEGAGPAEALKETGKGLGEGVAVTGALAGAGQLAEGGIDKLSDRRSELGRTNMDYRKAQQQGQFEKPAFKALKYGQEGVDQVADQVGQESSAYNAEMARKARDKFGAEIDKILGRPESKRFTNLDTLHERLDALDAENTTSNGERINKRLGSIIDDVRSMFTKDTGLYSPEGQVGKSGRTLRIKGGTFEDVHKAKKRLADEAEYGQVATAENRPYRLMENALNDEAKDLQPDLGKANDDFKSRMDFLERANDILGKGKNAVANDRAGTERTAAVRLAGGASLQNPGAAAGERQLEELAAADPKYAQLIDRIKAKSAYEATRAKLNPLELLKNPLRAAGQNGTALAVRGADPLLRRIHANLSPGELQGQMPALPGFLSTIEDAYAAALEQLQGRRHRDTRPQR